MTQTLESKIAASRKLLRDILTGRDPERIFVAYTGGKDSGVALALWREVLAEVHPGRAPRALSLDTGLKFPETTAFRDTLATAWKVRLEIVRPQVDLAAYPVAEDKVACCRDLKILPLNQAIVRLGAEVLISGIRADEHASRRDRPAVEPRTGPDYIMLNPLLPWTEMDVWSYIMSSGMGHCPLYDQGYRSLGCAPCTHLPPGADGAPGAGSSERAGRDQDKERCLSTLTSLGYF